MLDHAGDIITGIWFTVAAAWLMSTFRLKPVAWGGDRGMRITELLLLAFAGFLMIWGAPGTVLHARWLPEVSALAAVGVAMAACGAAFAIMARTYLGQNWSGDATIKRGHELVVRGPYSLVRHPIYTGLLVTLIGTAVAAGELRYLVAVPLAMLGFRVKVRSEERLFLGEFGDRYARYCRKVRGAIFPSFWAHRGKR